MNQTILVTDYDEDFLLLNNHIQKCYRQVTLTHVSTGEEVIEKLTTLPLPGLIILDAKMPLMTGYETIWFLSKDILKNGNYSFYYNGDTARISERGSITGFRDGTQVSISLIDIKQRQKWDILIRPFDPTPVNGFIKLDGTAELYRISKRDWVAVKKQSFFSSTNVE